MYRINEIIDQVLSYHPGADIELLQKAYVFTARAHEGQTRLSGEPYLSHPLEVAGLLSELKLDVVAIAAGLLHDTIEDTNTTEEIIGQLFGPEVSRIVEGITKISRLKFATKTEHQAENIRKMILAMANDIRVLLVKLSDRLHNMRTLGYHTPDKQKSIAQETLDIYAPLAGRLGIGRFRAQLEDLSLYYLETGVYESIKDGISRHRGQQEAYIGEIKGVIEAGMEKEGISGRVEGRFKHYYSIYRKMRTQSLSLDQLYDLIGFRVIVDSIRDCYEVLGLIHSIWRPIPGRFKDYIGIPKTNMYQSLQTAVVGPYGERMEIQIRTDEMHHVAEEGIAAHWRYKEHGSDRAMDPDESDRFAWLRHLLEMQRETTDPGEFLHTLRVDLFPEKIYVFTPAGDVRELPKQATPVDFAYAIHSEVGNKCQGARVNGRMTPLKQELKTGDIVEIITSKKQKPSSDWLNFVKTPKARARIRQWINTQDRDVAIAHARETLTRELKRDHLELGALIKDGRLEVAAKEFGFKHEDDVLAAMGHGKLTLGQVLGKLVPKSVESIEEKIAARPRKRRKKSSKSGIKVQGQDGILVRLAKCCRPLPGDDIRGFVTRGRGVTVHRADCPYVASADHDRLVDVSWDEGVEQRYSADIRVVGRNQRGFLPEISGVITTDEANILAANVKTDKSGRVVGSFTVQLSSSGQLNRILGELKRMKNVVSVSRQAVGHNLPLKKTGPKR